jgi:hypothetical protein
MWGREEILMVCKTMSDHKKTLAVMAGVSFLHWV